MRSQDNLKFDSHPHLRKPYIICGLNGSFNSGNVSVGMINYFINQFSAVKFAEMPTSRYHIYQIPGLESLRPVFRMQNGLITESHMPFNYFYHASIPKSEHDLVLFLGDEPNLNWEEYAETIVDLAIDLGAARLYTTCGLLDMTPYTMEPLISCTCTDARVKQEMDDYNVTFSNREGMASFGQMLVHTCKKKGLEGVNFTVRAPYYPEFNVFLSESPKSLKAVLVRLKDLMDLDMDFNHLDNVIKEMENKLNVIRQQNPTFNTFIEELEKKYVEMPYQKTLDISPSDAVRLAEEFLKNKGE